MKRKLVFAALVLSSVFMSGCVLGRRTVPLPVPQVGSSETGKGSVVVGAVEDARVFENKPPEPSTPSIDGDVHAVSKDELAMMIGRQRNSYGAAMGDIALPAGDSVIKLTRLLIEQGFKRRGYTISTDATSPNQVAVSIDRFWAWFTPGMWAVSFEAQVGCTLTVKRGGASSTLVVAGYGMNKGQVASDPNWQLAYDRAFQDFLLKLDAELSRAGF